MQAWVYALYIMWWCWMKDCNKCMCLTFHFVNLNFSGLRGLTTDLSVLICCEATKEQSLKSLRHTQNWQWEMQWITCGGMLLLLETSQAQSPCQQYSAITQQATSMGTWVVPLMAGWLFFMVPWHKQGFSMGRHHVWFIACCSNLVLLDAPLRRYLGDGV